MIRRKIAFLVGFSGLWLGGCSGGGEPEGVTDSLQLAVVAQDNAESALRGLYGAGSFVADSQTLAQVLGPLLSSSGDCVAEPLPCTPDGCPEPVPCEPEPVDVEDLQAARDDANAAIDDLVEVMREQIFTEDNLESETASSATYHLGPDVLCDQETTDPADDCVAQAERLQIRLRLTSPSAGDVDVELLLGPNRRNPLTLQLYDDRVGLLLDLGELKSTLDDLGESIEDLVELSGQLGAEIVRNAELDYSLRLNVPEDVRIGMLDDLGERIDLSLARSVPTMELRLDGNARQVIGSLDYGALRVAGPLNAFADSFEDDAVDSAVDPSVDPSVDAAVDPAPAPTYSGDIELYLAGLSGGVTLDGNQEMLRLDGLGLGDESSTLKHDGNTVMQVDVNPTQGRRFDLLVTDNPEGEPSLQFSPTIDLTLLFAFSHLADQIDDLPTYLLGDTLRLWMDGPEPTLRAEENQLRVESGALHLSSVQVPEANLDVPAGMCLVDSEVTDPAHEILSALSVATCE